MTKQPLLSICIPTYNREKHLKELLDSIIKQKGFGSEVEVRIYDDPSTDNTEIIASGYTKKYNNIHYHRNCARVGMTAAFLLSILECTGEYVWLVGSDDIIGPFGIQATLDIIKAEHPDIVLNNYGEAKNIDDMDDTLDYITYDNVSSFCNNFQKQSRKESNIKPIDHYISYFSYISIYCFRNNLFKSLYDSAIKSGKKDYLFGQYFNWAYILLVNEETRKITLCDSPTLTYNKSGGANGRKFSFKIVKDVKSIFQAICKHHAISNSTKILFNKILLTRFGWFIGSKIANMYIIKYIKKKYNPLYVKLCNLYMTLFRRLY